MRQGKPIQECREQYTTNTAIEVFEGMNPLESPIDPSAQLSAPFKSRLRLMAEAFGEGSRRRTGACGWALRKTAAGDEPQPARLHRGDDRPNRDTDVRPSACGEGRAIRSQCGSDREGSGESRRRWPREGRPAVRKGLDTIGVLRQVVHQLVDLVVGGGDLTLKAVLVVRTRGLGQTLVQF